MINLSKWLDSKKGNLIMRVYILGLLFISNLILTIGAAMHYLYNKSIVVFTIGIISTIICVVILSTPTIIDDSIQK